jgi:hypothetical protein
MWGGVGWGAKEVDVGWGEVRWMWGGVGEVRAGLLTSSCANPVSCELAAARGTFCKEATRACGSKESGLHIETSGCSGG